MNGTEFSVAFLTVLLLIVAVGAVVAKTPKQTALNPLPSPEPEHQIPQEPTIMADKTSLPYSILGEDYLLYYQSGDPSVWNSTEMLKFQNWKCNTARLGFSLDTAHWYAGMNSLYNQTKMDSVLNIFDAYGIKAILLLQNNGDHLNYCGTQSWVDSWVSIASHYAGDTRIAAFSIFGEPNLSTWADAGDYTSIGIINTKEKFIQVCKYCIDQIRAVDPTRKIVFPTVYGMGIGLDSVSTTYNLMNTYGVWAQGNIIMDILHPYFWEDYPSMDPSTTPEGTASWYGTNILDPWISLIGAGNCWIGETFAWYGENLPSGPPTHDLQVRWIKALVNVCLARGVGLDIWSYFGKQSWNNEGLTESNYLSYPLQGEAPPEPEPPIPPPPIQYYYVTMNVSGGGQVTPTGWITKQVGQTFTGIASPNTDYVFDHWTKNGIIVSGSNPTITITNGVADMTYNLVAYFTYSPPPVQTFTVAISSTTGGSCNPTGTQVSNVGTPLSVLATADGGYDFSYWRRNGSTWSVSNPVSVSGYSGQSISLIAVFEATPASPPTPDEPTTIYVYVEPSGGGTTNHTGLNEIDADADLSLRAYPSNNYRFNYWVIDGVNMGSTNPITVDGDAGDTINVYAYFQYVTPPPGDQGIPLSGENIGLIDNDFVTNFIKQQNNAMPIDIDKIMRQLARSRL
jgi:hypothetical protein